MTIGRRTFLISGASAAALAGCGGAPLTTGGGGGGSGAGGLAADLRPVANAGYDRWVTAFRQRAAANGISAPTLNAAFRGAGYLPGVVTRDRSQTESTRTLEDYLAITANEEKVRDGRAALARHRGLLAEIEARYGVPAETVTAIWGIESGYGARRGAIPVISATSTLAYDGRRGAFFERQLTAALRILERGDVSAARMTGSWAGAMGHTQFIPTTYQAYAVDFRGDGRRDIWSDDPTDALASAAAYLAKSGWQRGAAWGREVEPGTGGAIRPGGDSGPAFATGPNFRVILRYNNARKYAIAVGHLSDRIAGGGPLRTAFGPDRYGLTIADRKRLQAGLTAAGFDAGEPDGVLGRKTESAIRAYQRANGLSVTGEPSRALLARLT
ncbi:MAG: lytic murein transglycosylase [Pseudooceanicola sp.]